MATLIMNCLAVSKGPPDMRPAVFRNYFKRYRLLCPARYLALEASGLLIYDDGTNAVWRPADASDDSTCALLLTHGMYPGSVEEFLSREHHKANRVCFRGAIRIQGTGPRITGTATGPFRYVTRVAICEYPPFNEEAGVYLAEGESPWSEPSWFAGETMETAATSWQEVFEATRQDL
jgi:hypothetical protein